jgi:hypothetical protein
MKRTSTTALVLTVAAFLCGLQAQTADWTKYDSPEGQYSILFPGEPKLSTQEATAATGAKLPQYMAISVDSKNETFYSVLYFDLPSDMKFSFNDGRDGILNKVKGTLISEKAISIEDYSGRELKISAPNDGAEYIVRARFYLVGTRIYLLQLLLDKSADGPIADDKSVKFFDSFQLTKAK